MAVDMHCLNQEVSSSHENSKGKFGYRPSLYLSEDDVYSKFSAEVILCLKESCCLLIFVF